MKLWLGLIGAAALAICGCHHQKPHAPSAGATVTTATAKPGQPIVTIDNSLEGRILRLNSAGRFVVIAFPIGHLPALEQRLFVYRAGLKVGELKVTGPQLDDKVAADLSNGEAAEGDVVRDK
jgi:hypothetical protein